MRGRGVSSIHLRVGLHYNGIFDRCAGGGVEPVAELVLYGTLGCHLCELAEAALLPLVAQGVLIECIDIADDEQLLARYQRDIPVLVGAGGECRWPFDLAAAVALLERNHG